MVFGRDYGLQNLGVATGGRSSPGLTEAPRNEILHQSHHGYLLIRIVGAGGEKEARFEFTNQDTGYVVKVRTDSCKSAGPNARMCIAVSPPGRYSWSKYESEYRFRFEHSTIQDPAIRREAPGSASDTFEIVSGVINYVGDWEMRITSGDVSQRSAGQLAGLSMSRRWSVDISQNTKTLERLFERFPEYTDRYEIYLSMMGKKAISLQEFLEIVQKHSD